MKKMIAYAYRMLAELMTGQLVKKYNNARNFIAPPQYNQVPKYNTSCVDNQGNGGGFRGGGHGRGVFGRGRGPVTCHNFQQPRHYARDFPQPPTICMYCHATDHTIEECPILLTKI
jgi:hypothetical protein